MRCAEAVADTSITPTSPHVEIVIALFYTATYAAVTTRPAAGNRLHAPRHRRGRARPRGRRARGDRRGRTWSCCPFRQLGDGACVLVDRSRGRRGGAGWRAARGGWVRRRVHPATRRRAGLAARQRV